MDDFRCNRRQFLGQSLRAAAAGALAQSSPRSARDLVRAAETRREHAGLAVSWHKMIWDRAPHNAFTDLLRFGEHWYCSFREGSAHSSVDGTARILRSPDGQQWESVAHFALPGHDLRDPKMVVTPAGQLMCGCAARAPNEERQPMVWLSEDGRAWSEGQKVGQIDYWMWSWERCGDWVYTFAYQVKANFKLGARARPGLRLYRSRDGLNWEEVIDLDFGKEFVNEVGFTFAADGRCFALVRSDSGAKMARVGMAMPPYTEWAWHSTGIRISGPALLCLRDGRLLGGGRVKIASDTKTRLFWFDPSADGAMPAADLPSRHETGYPGLCCDGNSIWASYYSSQSGKPAIYVACMRAESTTASRDTEANSR